MNSGPNPEPFLLRQLASLEADLDRYIRILDALRLEFVRKHGCSDVDAELMLLTDADAKQIRRQLNQARSAWLSFHRTLEKHRKANPAPESSKVAESSEVAQSSEVASPAKPAAAPVRAAHPAPAPPAPPAQPRPQPEITPIR